MKQHTLFKKLLSILPPRQKANFLLILLILALSAVLSQVTPLAVGYLTDSVLTSDAITFTSVLVIAISVVLASRQVISVGTVLTAYLCFTQLTGPLRELHRILDEATSALDNTSEERIQQEIEAMKASCGTTVISIAHRLTTLRNCDEILVMDAGHIVQRGTYAQLERTPGIFQDMALGKLR